MLGVKCDRCGSTFPHLHTVQIVVDRDYGNLSLDEKQCVDCLTKFLASVKPEPSAGPPVGP
jgi:hypothetical protein